ncbi:MAG: hypothetical protein K0R57_5453 [Paenibacillaceae bacterium]|nr:hypothetical protein [Paenibacillaceae bacterium]
MTTKKLILIGTIAIMVTLNGATWNGMVNTAHASPLALQDKADGGEAGELASETLSPSSSDPLHKALGTASDAEIYDALYEGYSLAEIALSRGADVDQVISLQISQLAKQLDERLASGSITASVHQAQQQELYEIVSRSVYGG